MPIYTKSSSLVIITNAHVFYYRAITSKKIYFLQRNAFGNLQWEVASGLLGTTCDLSESV